MNNLKKILIVEDDEDDQFLLSEVFEGYSNVSLFFQDSCLKALNAIGMESYDFVLVDFRLGVLDSHPVVRRLLELGIPFSILSGSLEEEVKSELEDVFEEIKFWTKKEILGVPSRVMTLIEG